MQKVLQKKILSVCALDDKSEKIIQEKIFEMSSKGLRVIAIADQDIDNEDNVPKELSECRLNGISSNSAIKYIFSTS